MIFKKKKQAEVPEVAPGKEISEDEEFDLKFKVKRAKRETEKQIKKLDDSIAESIAKAADAKCKGYKDVYLQYKTLIRYSRARKIQAEKFLYQMDAMMQMRDIQGQTKILVGNMATIIGSLGALTFDNDAIRDMQKNADSIGRALDQQSMQIERALDMMSGLNDDVELDASGIDDDTIDSDINDYIVKNSIGSMGAPGTVNAASDADIDKYKKVINEN